MRVCDPPPRTQPHLRRDLRAGHERAERRGGGTWICRSASPAARAWIGRSSASAMSSEKATWRPTHGPCGRPGGYSRYRRIRPASSSRYCAGGEHRTLAAAGGAADPPSDRGECELVLVAPRRRRSAALARTPRLPVRNNAPILCVAVHHSLQAGIASGLATDGRRAQLSCAAARTRARALFTFAAARRPTPSADAGRQALSTREYSRRPHAALGTYFRTFRPDGADGRGRRALRYRLERLDVA